MKALLGNSGKRIEINFEGVDIEETDNLQEKYKVIFLKDLNNSYRKDIAYVYDKNKKKYAVYSFIERKFILPFEFSTFEEGSYMDGYFGKVIIAMKKYESYIETGIYSLKGENLFPMTKNVMVNSKIKLIEFQGNEVFRYVEVKNLTDECVNKIVSTERNYGYSYLWEFYAEYNKVDIYCIEKKQYIIPMQKVSDVYITNQNIKTYGIEHGRDWTNNCFFNIYYKKDLTWAVYSREGKIIIPPHFYMDIIICKNGIKAVKREIMEHYHKKYVSNYEFLGYERCEPKYSKQYSYKDCYSYIRCFDMYSYDGKLLSENNIEKSKWE